MTTIQAKISAAARVSDLVIDDVTAARDLLNGALMSNGYGVLVDPHDARRELRAAIERLTNAVKTIEGASWPTNQEYLVEEGEVG